jgi:hypothetical protein
LGSFYGIAGNGTIPDRIEILRDSRLLSIISKETGIAPSTSHSEWQIPQTFFFNELPGRYKLILITNNTETLEFEFIVKQITNHNKSNSTINNQNNAVDKNILELSTSKISPLKQIENGVSNSDVICSNGMKLVFKNTNNYPACVKLTSVKKLIELGWARN